MSPVIVKSCDACDALQLRSSYTHRHYMVNVNQRIRPYVYVKNLCIRTSVLKYYIFIFATHEYMEEVSKALHTCNAAFVSSYD